MGQDAVSEAKKLFAPGGNAELGFDRLRKAAEHGDGEAVALLAHFAASGLGGKPDWDRSVQMLASAAKLGWAGAGRELSVLTGDGAISSEAAGRVDIRSLVSPRPTEVLSESPRIRMCRSFLSADECAWLVELGSARLERAGVYDSESPTKRIVSARSNSVATFSPFDMDTVLVFLSARIANTIGLPAAFFEPLSILHYAVDQQFEPHHDYLDPAEPGMAADLQSRGQRVATFLVYLNEAYAGGETYFPDLGLRFRGRLGDALFFANVDLNGRPEPRTLHAGLPPTSGEKWLLSQWVRDRPPS